MNSRMSRSLINVNGHIAMKFSKLWYTYIFRDYNTDMWIHVSFWDWIMKQDDKKKK